LEILKLAKELLPEAEVILVTGHGTIPSAVSAMQQGAFNYLLKPLDLKQLRAVTEKAAASLQLRRANAELNRRLDEKFGFEGVVGNSPQMNDVIDRLQRIAPTDATVLIQGATGTGKELVAQAIHQNSPRKKKPFVALNFGALSEHILESELFGHVRGAFTDASTDRVGKFEYAHGGTLFLDEVGDMPLATQIKLLRVLESGEITRVGSNEPIKVNVRMLSATNRDLDESIASGAFRRDLYHRLKVVTITLPQLKERSQDIPLLIEHFVKQFAQRHNKQVKSIGKAPQELLLPLRLLDRKP
jgi:two-component system response regulator HydG